MKLQPRELNYVPTIALRASELNGLEKLPGPSKDRIQPVFLLAPWPNAQNLSKAMDRLEKAFPKRPYALDLDRDYQAGSDTPAAAEFSALKKATNGYENWKRFIADYPNASPCLQHVSADHSSLLGQIEFYQDLGRTFVVRIEIGKPIANIGGVVAALNEVGSSDYFVVLDGGWVQDAMQLAARMSGLLSGELSDLSADVPVVLTCTTIPKGFDTISGIKRVDFANRALLQQVRANHNYRTLVYGDWGSTRPREYSRASPPLPRIDFPVRSQWLIARNKKEKWTFNHAAKAITATDEWKNSFGLGVWGEEMITKTAIAEALGINSPQKNVASRVNIHLHTQAFADRADLRGINLDEPWED